jgi:hypothetical protein
MKKLLFLLLLLPFGLSSQAQYSVNSVYGNHIDCDTLTQGIWIVWWDNDWDYSLDAAELLDSLDGIRNDCLGYLNMQDPPNPTAGYYYNVYLHHGADIFPSAWANGQGTDSNGFPFLTLPIGAHNDFVNVCHEGFHVFQYSANSPGFAYAGDSQWYIEASANWYAQFLRWRLCRGRKLGPPAACRLVAELRQFPRNLSQQLAALCAPIRHGRLLVLLDGRGKHPRKLYHTRLVRQHH